MPNLRAVLKKFVTILQQAKKDESIKSFSLIGGFAVSARSRPRATQDIDFLIEAEKRFYTETLPKKLKSTGFTYEVFDSSIEDPLHGLTRIYTKDGIEIVDLIPVFWKWQSDALQRAEEVQFEAKFKIPILRLEDLVVFKLHAGGPQDLVDVENLLKTAQQNKTLNRSLLLEMARRVRVDKKLKQFLKDPS